MEKLYASKIDLNKVKTPEIIAASEYPSSPASTAMELGALAMKFARVERVPRYDERTRENDAEHSFMLALVATELADQLYPGKLNPALVTQFSMVHDLIELKTGDVATFHYDSTDMAAKQAIEHAALEELLAELPPYIAHLLRTYEEQKLPEAIFVRGVDKQLPIIVDILGAGKKVMNEDYGVSTAEELEKGHTKLHSRIANSFKDFPELVEMHELFCELFQIEFEASLTQSS